MKYLIFALGVMVSAPIFAGDYNQTEEIYIQFNGEFQSLEVDSNDVNTLIMASSVFYECRPVPGGWRRCSKRKKTHEHNACFGATFKYESACESALNSNADDDDDDHHGGQIGNQHDDNNQNNGDDLNNDDNF